MLIQPAAGVKYKESLCHNYITSGKIKGIDYCTYNPIGTVPLFKDCNRGVRTFHSTVLCNPVCHRRQAVLSQLINHIHCSITQNLLQYS